MIKVELLNQEQQHSRLENYLLHAKTQIPKEEILPEFLHHINSKHLKNPSGFSSKIDRKCQLRPPDFQVRNSKLYLYKLQNTKI